MLKETLNCRPCRSMFLKDPIGRQVALARDLAADLGVLESVEVVTRRVEDRVMS